MAADLRGASFGITTPVHTLHDRPAAHLQPILEPSHRHATLHRLEPTRSEADAIMAGTTRLLVSSTSWTPDEDFQMLLDALMSYTSMYDEYQRKPGQSGQIPRVLVVITGRGPQKSKYEALVGDLTAQGRLSGVEISTAWLSTEDYAALLACADLGVCLHTSSSGVDLPMKVVDMFGAGIPVVAYGGYKSFSELVSEGVNGHGFTTVPELAKILSRLLSAGGKRELVRLKAGAVKEGSLRWDEEWDRVVAKQVGVV
jgi:beta-1,4-mannosyltransferase